MSISSETEESNNNEESNRPACAACKHQRKKCKKGCAFLLHFPANRHQEFSAVHQIFGIANINKMMKDIDLAKQGQVVESIIWEAMVWTNRDHKEHGPYGLYRRLEEDYKRLEEGYKRLEEDNKRLREPLLKSQQELQIPPKPHTPGIVSKSSWQGENCTDVRGLSRVENYSSYRHGNENLLLNSTVNSYSPGLGFPAASPPPSLFFRQEEQMREGGQEKGRDRAILPLSAWPPGPAMLPQSTRPGQAREGRTMNVSNYSGPSTPHPTSLEGRSFVRYYPYLLPQLQYPPPPMQNNGPQGGGFALGLPQQYPLVNSAQNNVSDQYNQVKPKAAREDNTC